MRSGTKSRSSAETSPRFGFLDAPDSRFESAVRTWRLGGGDQRAAAVTAAPARTADGPAWLDDPLVAPTATLAPARRADRALRGGDRAELRVHRGLEAEQRLDHPGVEERQ